MHLNHYEQEIVPKGKSYLVLTQGPLADLRGILAQERAKGARQVFLCSKAEPLCEGSVAGVRLAYAHDMMGMSCALDDARPRPGGRLVLEPLTREKKELFLQIYNDSFFAVPNSETYGDEEFEQIMGPAYRCGFALEDGQVVGIYELGFKKEHPEIGSIGLTAGARGRGLGRELLLTVMDALAALGHRACWLQASTANREAYPLYQAVGFTVTERLGRWYEVTEDDG